MKRIAGVSLWIWGIGAVVVTAALMVTWPLLHGPQNEAVGMPTPVAETPRQRTERLAHECLETMKTVRRYCIENPMIEVPKGLPYGDRMELQRSADERSKMERELHERRKAAESKLEEAEKEYPAGYLRALRNAWGETIRREVYEKSQQTIEDFDFEAAIALGLSVSQEQ